ncbi:hypothetical protein EJ110_NYTH33268 [Nymphaea thermarum]|nr:hypothetical protein EJ110_NYTH33268 [Nymphaea thermarum]
MNVVTQAFVGHLGDLELAAVSIAKTVNVALNLELMVMWGWQVNYRHSVAKHLALKDITFLGSICNVLSL